MSMRVFCLRISGALIGAVGCWGNEDGFCGLWKCECEGGDAVVVVGMGMGLCLIWLGIGGGEFDLYLSMMHVVIMYLRI
jgi:hypothetical protein